MKYKILTFILGFVFSVSSIAEAELVIKSASSSAKSSLQQSCIITKDSNITLQLLDSCWNKRENKETQNLLAEFLLTVPTIPNDYEISWKTARLVYFIGNFGAAQKRFADSKDGIKLFNFGAAAGKLALKQKPNKVEGYYWYAVDLGSYGLAKGILSAASNAKDGMEALNKSYQIDPSYQWYGSSRILGRYYEELPGIFGGSSKKALELFEEATTKAPNFANNWLSLGRFYLSEKDYNKALNLCKKALSAPLLDGRFEEMRYRYEAKQCINSAKAKIN